MLPTPAVGGGPKYVVLFVTTLTPFFRAADVVVIDVLVMVVRLVPTKPSPERNFLAPSGWLRSELLLGAAMGRRRGAAVPRERRGGGSLLVACV